MLNYSIRPCQPADLTVLVQLCHQHARYEQAAYEGAGKEERLHQALFGEHPSLHCWIVEAVGQPAGYATFTFDYSTWDAGYFLHLDCLYLEPGYRGQGIGETLLRRLQQLAAEKGCVNVQWQTPDFNEGAIRFYKRMGGTGREKVRFILPVTALP